MTDSGSSTLPSWVASFFDGVYAQCDLIWDEQTKSQSARFLMELCPSSSGAPLHFFDQCCGQGQLALALAQRGARGYGVDQSVPYIQSACDQALATGLSDEVTFVQADAGQWSTPSLVDMGINWHTSLGYGGARGAQQLLRQLHASVRPDGIYLLDVRNVEHYLEQDTTSIREVNHPQLGPVLLRRSGQWDHLPEGPVLTQHWVLQGPGGGIVWEQVGARCFHPRIEEISQLLAGNDQVVDVFSDIQGRRDRHGPRQLIVVKRYED